MPEVLFFFREERAVKTERLVFPLEVAQYLIDHNKGKKKPFGTQGKLTSDKSGVFVMT